MSWLFSQRMVDEYMSSLQSRICAEAQRAKDLLSDLSPKEQCQGSQWSENWSAIQAIQAALDQGRLLEDAFRKAPIREWAQIDSCSCDGNGDKHWESASSRRMRSSQKRNQDGQPAGKPKVDETRRTISRAQFRSQQEAQPCEGALCVSLRYLRALAEEYSEATCSDGEQSAPSSGPPTQQAYCSPDKMTGLSRLSRFGMTFRPLTEDRGEALLMSYLAASRARTSAQPEAAPASKESAAACGSTWPASSVKYDPASSSWKTAHCLWDEDLPWSSVTLPTWGMTRSGSVYRHPTAERPMSGTGAGLWPTPTANNFECRDLDAMLSRRERAKAKSGNGNGFGLTLGNAVRLYPTPTASQHKGLNESETHGRLNPLWVEWLMGWPLGWSDLKQLEMDKFREWRQQHLPSSLTFNNRPCGDSNG